MFADPLRVARQLTVVQPLASFLVTSPDQDGPQLPDRPFPMDVLTRRRRTSWRGLVLVRAGRRLDQRVLNRFGVTGGLQFPLGAVVGTVRLVDVAKVWTSPWAEPDPFLWRFEEPEQLRSAVECGHRPGLHVPTAAVLSSVLSLLRHQQQAAPG